MSKPTSIPFEQVPAILKEGDVLLMRGDSAISELIIELAGGHYSHAGFWSSSGKIIDAGPDGVVPVDLEVRLDSEELIDVWRFSKQGHELGDDGWPESDLETSIHRYVNKPDDPTRFGYHQLVMVALLIIVKAGTESIHGSKLARMLFELALEALDRFLDKGQRVVTCSGLVYRTFDEAHHPGQRNRHQYRIQVDNPYVIPPDALGLEGAPLQNAVLAHGVARLGDAAPAAERFLEVYAQTEGLASMNEVLERSGGHVYPGFVSPADLERSPDLRRIGRIARDGRA